MIIKRIQALFQPEQYHGWGRTNKYFEGWYYKIVNLKEDRAFAFIPGIAMDEKGKQQSFVQVLDGKKLTAEYHKFEAEEFIPEVGKFEVRIANNFFSANQITLYLPSISGELYFKNLTQWPNTWYSPGIMGPFSFVPFMECYHGILSMDHHIEGKLSIHNETIDFTGGRGYIEKDWGHSFPSAYIWLQSNHFSTPGISLKASVAKIPWLGSSFVGFIAGVWLEDRLIQFTTYNFTWLKKSYVDQTRVELVMENRNYNLKIITHREASTELAAPISGFMDARIEESMLARVEVQLTDKKTKKILLEDIGRNTALEVAGKIEEILI